MELQKYKVCPVCGELNPPSLLECRKCETDLTGIRITDSSAVQCAGDTVETAESLSSSGQVLVRICDCGTRNLPQARKCIACGEDISDILPEPAEDQETHTILYELKSVCDGFGVSVEKPVFIVGREAELQEYLAAKMYVSRVHAKFTAAAGKVFLENLSHTNKTYINNTEISDSEPAALNDGDEIGLGGTEIGGRRQDNAAYFVFREKS